MKKLFNALGFTLVEILIVLGLIGGVSLIVMNLTKQTNQTSTKHQFDTETTLITNEINGLLSDPNKCLTTFTNATQGPQPALPVLNAIPSNVLAPTAIASTPSTTRKFLTSGGPYGNGGVKINSYSLDLTATPDPILTINFQKKSILGSGSTPKRIRLYVEKNGSGVITLCRAVSSTATDIWSRGSGSSIFYNGGRVGIGTLSPQATLDVAGEAKIGNTGLPCNATTAGAMRYNASVMEYCDGTNWAAIGGGGTQVNVYKCPSGCAGCNGGAWGSYTCQGQYTSQTTCHTIEYPCSVTCNCPYVGKMMISP